MTMTRKDYEVIANVFSGLMADIQRELDSPRTEVTGRAHVAGERAATITLASRLAVELQQTNPRFDCQRFIEACGVK
jgi:hypothetical protein